MCTVLLNNKVYQTEGRMMGKEYGRVEERGLRQISEKVSLTKR